MIRSRGKKIIGDVLSRKGRTALVALSIMIGVFGVGTLVGMNDLIVSQLNEDLQPEHIAMTHAYVISQGTSITPSQNQEYIDALSDLPGVLRVEGQAVYRANWKEATASADAGFTEANILAYTEPWEQVDLEPISRIVKGRYPESGQGEIAVEQRFADANDVGVGDKLVFRQLNDAETGVMEWEIVGIVFHPYFTISIVVGEDIAQEENIYATYEDAQQIAGFPGLSSFYARYTDVPTAEANLQDFLETISTQTPYIPVFSFIDNPEDNFLIGQVKQVTGVLDILAAVSMIVSGFLVTNVINTIVSEQKGQIGVLKSLGATRRDNFLIYAGMALVYGIIGTVIGVLLSIPAALFFAKELASLALTMIEGFQISVTGILVAIALGLIVPVIAALIPVFNGTRVTVLEAMTDLGISSDWGNSRLARFIGALPIPINIRQALSNIAQKKGRLALTGLTLTLAVAAFMGVTAVFTALGDQIDALFDTFQYDVRIDPQEAQDFETVRTLLVDNIDGVENVFAGYGVAIGIEGYESTDPISEGSNQLGASGIDPASPVIKFDLQDGTGWQEDPTREGVIITRPLAEKLDKTLGDTIVFSLSGNTHEQEIIGIDRFPFDAIFFDWKYLATTAGFVDENGAPLPGTFYVSLEGDASIEEVDDAINEMTELLLANGIQASYVNQPQDAEDSAAEINLFALILNMVSVVMAAVGAVGLLATLSMAVFERQKEIGVMRSIGAGSATIVTQFLVEGILVGVLAWIVALPLSFGLGYILVDALDFGEAFVFEYPPMVAVFGLIGVVVVATVASLWPSISAARRTVSDILRYQ